MNSLKYVTSFIVLLIICSCEIADVKSEVYDWNYLVYMGADNNLERFAIDNILDMQKVGSTNNINILVLLDRSPGYDKSNDNWSGTRLYKINKSNKDTLDLMLLKDYGELDMTAPDTLENFITYSHKNFPSKKTALVLWSHGTGVYPDGILYKSTKSYESRAVIHDYSTGYDYGDSLSIQDLEIVLSNVNIITGNKINLLQFDSCLMMMNEVIWQLADQVDYIIGAEVDVPGPGNDYINNLSFLINNSVVSEDLIATNIIDNFYNYYFSTTISTGYSALNIKNNFLNYKIAFTSWIDALINLNDVGLKKIYELRSKMFVYQESYPEYVDLYYFMKKIIDEPSFKNTELDLKTQQLIIETKKLIFHHKETQGFKENIYGMGINFPYTKTQMNYYIDDGSHSYPIIKFAQNTRWVDFLQKIILYEIVN